MLEEANAQGNAWDKGFNVTLVERRQTSSRSSANIQPKGTESIVKDRVSIDIGARYCATIKVTGIKLTGSEENTAGN